jgi:hypothetical protein
MKGSGAFLWMASCIGAAIAAEGDWKPFAYLSPDENPLSDLNLSTSLSLSPKIQVQSVYSEGLGWEASHPLLADSPAMHVIVTLTGKDPRPQMIDASIPLGSQKVFVKSQFPLPCIVEEGKGGFDDCQLGPKTARAFRTNAMGRVSFSIPTDALASLEDPFPPIFIQTQFMESSQWYGLTDASMVL